MIAHSSGDVLLPGLGGREVKITRGSLKNWYISFSKIRDFVPTSTIGGARKGLAGTPLLTFIFDGRSFRSDIASGRKCIIRNRSLSGTKGFFISAKARVGDVIIIDQIADYVYCLRLKRKELS
jgi:hypothetical protein